MTAQNLFLINFNTRVNYISFWSRLTELPADFKIQLFDLQGRQVEQLFSGKIDGAQVISCEPEKLNSGIYFIRIQSEKMDKTIKVCYVR